MNKLITILLLFLSTTVFSQTEKDIIYNKEDTTWTLQYNHMLSIRENIENLKNEKDKLKEEIHLLDSIQRESSMVIKKLQLRDTLCTVEIQHYQTMDSIMREKINRYEVITTNYNMLLLSTQDQLDLEAKKAKREKLLKNIYKYGYPALAAIGTLIVILK